MWQLVYFNLILQVDSSIAALESLLLEVVAMFFCAPCRSEFYVLSSRSTDHRVISCEGEAYGGWQLGAWQLSQLGQICYVRESERTTLRVRELVIVERRQEYYITAVTLAASITRLCIAGSNAPSWQNRTRNWRTVIRDSARLESSGDVRRWLWRYQLECDDNGDIISSGVDSRVTNVTCDDRTACLATSWTSWPSCSCTTTVEICAREGRPSARPTSRSVVVARVEAVRCPLFKSFWTSTDCPQLERHIQITYWTYIISFRLFLVILLKLLYFLSLNSLRFVRF